jgi:hypothetical protein
MLRDDHFMQESSSFALDDMPFPDDISKHRIGVNVKSGLVFM